MADAYGPLLIQNADDGPGILTQADDGKLFMWSQPDRRVIMVAPPTVQGQRVIGHFGGYSIQQAADGPGALTIADNGKALTWNQATGHFVMATVNAADADTLDGLDSTAFLLATGTRTGASSQAQTFTNGTKQAKIIVPTDSTDSFDLRNAADSASVFSVDTTNLFFGVGISPPTSPLHVSRNFGTLLAAQTVVLNNYVAVATTAAAGNALLRALSFSVTVNGATNQLEATAITGNVFVDTTAGTTTTETGSTITMRVINAGSVGTGSGYRSLPLLSAAGNMTIFNHFEARGPSVTSTGVLGTSTGLLINPQKVTGVTTGRGIWQTGASDINAMVGPTAFGSTTTPTAAVDILAGTTAQASLRMRVGVAPTTPNDGDHWYDGAFTKYAVDATTNAIVDTIRMRRASSGTPAAGFGVGFSARLMSSTTANRDAGRLTWKWDVATEGSQAAQGDLTSFYTTTERVCISWKANSTVPLLGFFGTAPVIKQVSGADLTNSVTAGGSTDVIANYTDLLVYANDAAAIRNDIYQLAKKLKQINDGLRALGLFT